MPTDSKTEANSAERPSAVVVSEVLLYREGIAAGIARLGDFRPVVPACARELPALLESLRPAVMFVDVSRSASCDTARLARTLARGLLVIGFGMTSDDEGLAGAEAGVTAFVAHDGTIEDLNSTARAALNGVPVCPAPLMTRLLQRVEQMASIARPASAGLTRRERQIASLVEDGMSNKEIAGALNISPATVKNHVHMILDKLNLPRRRLIVLGDSRSAREPAE
jgi:two-component system, NarL family, nitrate/nitrite response regulator NarL